jgi:hypothetical protein
MLCKKKKKKKQEIRKEIIFLKKKNKGIAVATLTAYRGGSARPNRLNEGGRVTTATHFFCVFFFKKKKCGHFGISTRVYETILKILY